MKPHSMVFRLAWVHLTVAAVLVLAFSASAILLSARTLEHQEALFLETATAHIAAGLDAEWVEHGGLQAGAVDAIKEHTPPGVKVQVLDEHGAVVSSSPGMGVARSDHEMRRARVHVPRGAWVITEVSTRPRREAISALMLALAFTALPLLIVTALVSRWLAKLTLHPLSRMTQQAEHASREGSVTRLGGASDPLEIGILATAFNRLLARLNEMLRAERNFTQDAAHELRTPLTVLSGELEYALSDATLLPRSRESLRHARDQIRGMSELIEALLLLRRTDQEILERHKTFLPVNLGDLVRDVAEELRGRYQNRVDDLALTTADEVLVAGDSALLTSAIRNLLSNAFNFSEPGQPISVLAQASDGEALVVVEDGGQGVAPEDRERIFDPYFRSPEARAHHEGFGLGLPILRRVARAHGGDVVVLESSLGGAKFELRLPAWTPEPKHPAPITGVQHEVARPAPQRNVVAFQPPFEGAPHPYPGPGS